MDGLNFDIIDEIIDVVENAYEESKNIKEKKLIIKN